MFNVHLLAHNGVAGANRVSAFVGAKFPVVGALENPLTHEGRIFTLSHIEGEGTDTEMHCFREKVVTKPSAWALAREADRAERASHVG